MLSSKIDSERVRFLSVFFTTKSYVWPEYGIKDNVRVIIDQGFSKYDDIDIIDFMNLAGALGKVLSMKAA